MDGTSHGGVGVINTVALRAVFFCGHKSSYGLAHLAPLLDGFNVIAVFIGTDQRWELFRQNLAGKVYYEPRSDESVPGRLRSLSKRILSRVHISHPGGEYRSMRKIRKTLKLKGIPLTEIFDVNSSDAIEKLKSLEADLFLSAAYPQIFSKNLLAVPKEGAVNFHPSLLPKYRGAHPHFWQIVNGETEGGLTAHFMTENIDDGDIIAQLSFPIDDCMYSELYAKIVKHTPQLVNDVKLFFETRPSRAKQQRAEAATYYRNDREIHSRIFWNIHTTQEIYNLIRTGMAFCFFRNERILPVLSYMTNSNRNLTNEVRVENGSIVDIGRDGIAVKTVDGCINIQKIQSGRRKMTFFEWARHRNIFVGEKFE